MAWWLWIIVGVLTAIAGLVIFSGYYMLSRIEGEHEEYERECRRRREIGEKL